MPENSSFAYDLFVSYADADREWVQGYLLPSLGLPPDRTITPEGFRLGASLASQFEQAVTTSRYTVLIVSSAYLADEWSTYGEQLASHASVAESCDRLIPLVRQRCELPLRIDFRVRLDCSDADSWDREVGRLRELLGQPEPESERIRCPYPGMLPFRSEEFFFGREEEIDEMLGRLRHPGYLFVIGPSGSGKSSLVRAGLLPRLTRSDESSEESWLIREMRPGNRPFATLTEIMNGEPTQASVVTNLLAAHGPAQRLLLFVDQFEEMFTQNDVNEQNRFIAALQAMRDVESFASVITMRADFYPDLMSSNLWPLDFGQRLEIAQLRGNSLRKAIRGPAMKVGVHPEAALVERLLSDGDEQPGVLPLLQETMVLLWSRRRQRLLPLSSYEQLGSGDRSGLAVAIATKADACLSKLTPAGLAIARRILLRLIQFGDGCSDTRRQQRIDELRSPDDERRLFDQTLQVLTTNRLVTLSGQESEGAKTVDVAHEALIRSWPQLASWVEEDRTMLQWLERIRESAQEWELADRRQDLVVHRGAHLKDCVKALSEPGRLNVTERDYLQTCVRAEKWRWITRLGSVLSVILLAAIVAGLSGWLMRIRGDKRDAFVAERVRRVLSPEVPLNALTQLVFDKGTAEEHGFHSREMAIESVAQGLRYELGANQKSLSGQLDSLDLDERLQSQRRVARTVLALAHLGQFEELNAFLSSYSEPTVRTYLLHELYLWVPRHTVLRLMFETQNRVLDQQERVRALDVNATSAERRRACADLESQCLQLYCLILSLAEFPWGDETSRVDPVVGSAPSEGALTESEKTRLLSWLLADAYRDHADPGVHAAARWLLQQRFDHERLEFAGTTKKVTEHLRDLRSALSADQTTADHLDANRPDVRRWYLDSLGTTMVVFPPGCEFPMGDEEDRGIPPADAHRRQIPRSFAIGATELTVGQIKTFDKEAKYAERVSTTLAHPMNSDQATIATWKQFCDWHSRQRRYSEFFQSSRGSDAQGASGTGGGFRPPTEAEWEYACRAGSTNTSFFFGDDARFLRYYAVLRSVTCEPIGSHRPSPHGLFDVYGNVAELCLGPARPYQFRTAYEADEDPTPTDFESRHAIIRGGSFRNGAESSYAEISRRISSFRRRSLMIVSRNERIDALHSADVGLRLCRTIGVAD